MLKYLNLHSGGRHLKDALPVLENIEKNSVDTYNSFVVINNTLNDLEQHYITTDMAIETIRTILKKYEN